MDSAKKPAKIVTRGATTDEAWWRNRGEEIAGRDRTNLIERFQIPDEKRIARAKDRKVGFLVAGTAKGGTTALDSYLRLHAQICMPHKVKEVNFFNTSELFQAGEPDYRLYHAFFKPKQAHLILGDASPDYMFRPEAARRIYDYNPEMRIVLALRNPVDRAFSHWNMARALGFEKLSFSEAIRGEEKRIRAADTEEARNNVAFIGRGYYLEQIRRLRRYFDPGQMIIIEQEDLLQHHQATLAQIWQFLDLEPLESIPPLEKIKGHYLDPMSEADRAYLREVYASDIRGLERLLERDFSHWLA